VKARVGQSEGEERRLSEKDGNIFKAKGKNRVFLNTVGSAGLRMQRSAGLLFDKA
jgi:hypothetical protein